jgi:hypothetical protein
VAFDKKVDTFIPTTWTEQDHTVAGLCPVVVKYVRIVANDYFGASKLLFLNQIVVIVVIVIENTHYKGAIFCA